MCDLFGTSVGATAAIGHVLYRSAYYVYGFSYTYAVFISPAHTLFIERVTPLPTAAEINFYFKKAAEYGSVLWRCVFAEYGRFECAAISVIGSIFFSISISVFV